MSYLAIKFDLDLSGTKACFRSWPSSGSGSTNNTNNATAATAGNPNPGVFRSGKTRTTLSVGVLGSGKYTLLTSTRSTCYQLGSSVRMVGSP